MVGGSSVAFDDLWNGQLQNSKIQAAWRHDCCRSLVLLLGILKINASEGTDITSMAIIYS